ALATVAIAVSVLAAMAAMAAHASSPPNLPAIGPDRLVASVIRAAMGERPVSGEISVHLDLGIPDVLGGALGDAAGGIMSFLGDHHLRVWRSSDGLRISDILSVGERSIFVSVRERDAWTWDSTTFTATQLPLTSP